MSELDNIVKYAGEPIVWPEGVVKQAAVELADLRAQLAAADEDAEHLKTILIDWLVWVEHDPIAKAHISAGKIYRQTDQALAAHERRIHG